MDPAVRGPGYRMEAATAFVGIPAPAVGRGLEVSQDAYRPRAHGGVPSGYYLTESGIG